MKLYKFLKKNGTGVMLTSKEDGDNLPEGSGAWIFEKSLEINKSDPPRIGASSEEILKGIKLDGIFPWPEEGK